MDKFKVGDKILYTPTTWVGEIKEVSSNEERLHIKWSHGKNCYRSSSLWVYASGCKKITDSNSIKFKIGDRVAVYQGSSKYIGIVELVTLPDGLVYVSGVAEEFNRGDKEWVAFHYKQCRRLKKKPNSITACGVKISTLEKLKDILEYARRYYDIDAERRTSYPEYLAAFLRNHPKFAFLIEEIKKS